MKTIRNMLLVIIGIFVFSQICPAAKLNPTKIVVPTDKGRIVETYVSPNADAPLIAYVQDIHMNYEAQKTEATVLESLIRDYGFDLVLLEGKDAGLQKDFKYLRNRGAKEGRVQAAEKLLKDGTIGCVDYLDITSDYVFAVEGIEDVTLYKKETEDHIAIFSNQGEMVKIVAILQNITSNLKLHIYSKEMRDLDDRIAAYNKDEIGLVEYVRFLEGLATGNNIAVKALPNAALFVEASNLEGQIDFAAVETERIAAADAVEKALADKAKEEFTAKGLQFRTGDISQAAFYTYLKDTAQNAKVEISPHKNLVLYTQYITTYEKIDTNILFKEIDQLVDKIKAALIKTPEQTKLSQIDKALSIISDFVNTKLVPDEYNFYLQNKAEFDLDGWLKFLKDNSARFNLTNPVPDDVSALKTNMPLLERFYAVSFDRDNAFIANIKSSMSKLNKDKAIFIAGGFHTPNIKRLFKEQGFSYLIVAPRVEVIKDYSGIYKERTKIDLKSLSKTSQIDDVTVPLPVEKK